jgi:kynurenine formamidase
MSSAGDAAALEDLGPSNWGRWGPEDQRGTLNLITPAMIVAAASLVREGAAVSLSAAAGPGGPVSPLRGRTWHTTSWWVSPIAGVVEDVLTINSHAGTHIDALSHALHRGRMYNGYDAAEHVTSKGVTRNAVTNIGAIVARGVLLDIAAYRGVEHLEMGAVIEPGELDACAAAAGVALGAGDVCLVRTGWHRVFAEDRERFDAGWPGISHLAAGWFHERGLVALGADNCAVDVIPGEAGVRPYGLHPRVVNQQGGYLIEYLDLEELARRGRAEFLFVAAPLMLEGAAGSPLNPVAIL